MTNIVNTFVVPGDDLHLESRENKLKNTKNRDKKKILRIGHGLCQKENQVLAIKPGIVRYRRRNDLYYIENNQKRYVPVIEDMVIGIIRNKFGDNFKVDIGGAHAATLSSYAFEGATKKNRPYLNVADIVYARVTVANKDMEPELECMSVRKKTDGYGHLPGGLLFRCSQALCTELLSTNSYILDTLGQYYSFEIAVGINGRVWIKSNSEEENNLRSTIVLRNAILLSEGRRKTDILRFIRQLVKA